MQHVLLDSCFPVEIQTLSPFLISRPGASSNSNNYNVTGGEFMSVIDSQSFIETRGLLIYGSCISRNTSEEVDRHKNYTCLVLYCSTEF